MAVEELAPPQAHAHDPLVPQAARFGFHAAGQLDFGHARADQAGQQGGHLVGPPRGLPDQLDLEGGLDRADQPDFGGHVRGLGACEHLAVLPEEVHRQHVELEPQRGRGLQTRRLQDGRDAARAGQRHDAVERRFRPAALEVAVDHENRLACGRDVQRRLLDGAAEIEEVGLLEDQGGIQPLARERALEGCDARLDFGAGGVERSVVHRRIPSGFAFCRATTPGVTSSAGTVAFFCGRGVQPRSSRLGSPAFAEDRRRSHKGNANRPGRSHAKFRPAKQFRSRFSS